MNIVSTKEKEDYIKENHLEKSFLPFNILYMCRGTIPAKIEVGKVENEYELFFEEGISSFKRRHYKLQKDVTSWNLIMSNGKTTTILGVDDIVWLRQQKEKEKIEITGNYTVDFLIKFLKTKNKKVNPLKPPKTEEEKKVRFQKWLTKEEIRLVNEFVEKLRKLTKEQ